MARVVVDVMPKPEILDPQGKAVHGALPRLGFEGVSDVRQGKRFELEVDGEVTDEVLADVARMAETLATFAPGSGAARGYERFQDLSDRLRDISERYFFWRSVGSIPARRP